MSRSIFLLVLYLIILYILELSVKSLKERRDRGFYPSVTKLSIKIALPHCTLEPDLKVGRNFGTSSFHLLNFEDILGSKTRCVHGSCCPKS